MNQFCSWRNANAANDGRDDGNGAEPRGDEGGDGNAQVDGSQNAAADEQAGVAK